MNVRSLRAAVIIAVPVTLLLAASAAFDVDEGVAAQQRNGGSMTDVRLMTLDPGHFHAALVQKEMYPNVAPRVDVFAPLGPDLIEHLNRIAAYNRRTERPTAWQLEIHTSPDYFERMLRERPGNVVVLSGRNGIKIDRIARLGQGRAQRARRQAVDPRISGSARSSNRRSPKRTRRVSSPTTS